MTTKRVSTVEYLFGDIWGRRIHRLFIWSVWLYLFFGLFLYFSSAVIYMMENISFPELPFWERLWAVLGWDTFWVGTKALFIGWLALPDLLGRVLAVVSALWLYSKPIVLGFRWGLERRKCQNE